MRTRKHVHRRRLVVPHDSVDGYTAVCKTATNCSMVVNIECNERTCDFFHGQLAPRYYDTLPGPLPLTEVAPFNEKFDTAREESLLQPCISPPAFVLHESHRRAQAHQVSSSPGTKYDGWIPSPRQYSQVPIRTCGWKLTRGQKARAIFSNS